MANLFFLVPLQWLLSVSTAYLTLFIIITNHDNKCFGKNLARMSHVLNELWVMFYLKNRKVFTSFVNT